MRPSHTANAHDAHMKGAWLLGIKMVKCHTRTYDVHKTWGVAIWKSSVLDPWKVYSACTKGAWNQVGGMEFVALYTYIEQLHLYSAWQLHKIHA